MRLLRIMNNQLNIVPQADTSLANLESLGGDHQVSLSSLLGARIFFRSDFSKEAIPLQNLEEVSGECPYQIRTFASGSKEKQVTAIDSSCVLIGETDEGSIYAGRVAIVSAKASKILRYYRAGPFIFYMTMKYLSEHLRNLLPQKALRAIASDNSLAERFVRIKLERSAQILSSKLTSGSIILVDGALKSSSLEPKDEGLRELEDSAESNDNQLLGVGKSSALRVVSRAANLLQNVGEGERYFDITETVRLFFSSTQARVLVVKFSPKSQVFRVDVSRRNSEEDSLVLSNLKRNDLIFRGYPESLRLAHHLSVFDASTISSIRSFLSKKYNLIHIPSDDLRATILGKLV
jgi:NurA domain